MLLFSPSEKIALRQGNNEITFAELARAMEREALEPLAFLEAEQTIAFAVRALAYLQKDVPFVLVAKGMSAAELEARRKVLAQTIHPETKVILFTSGSTGAPKAVQLSAGNILANREAVEASLDFAKAPAQGLFLSLSYSFGFFGQLLPALHCQVPTVLHEKILDIREQFMSGEAAGMWSGVPSHWETLARLTLGKKNPHVTHVISAGAALSLPLRKKLRELFPAAKIYNNYGLTEASPRVLSFSSEDPSFFVEGTVGYAVKHLQVKTELDGELVLSGKQVMLGYVGGSVGKIQSGWLRSGDLAKIDESGLVSILGRKDDQFNIGGERTSPLEIDFALANLPGVQEAAISVGQHEIHGAKITAYLVGNPPAKAEILVALKKVLSGHKIPTDFILVNALPKNENGKLKRSELAQLTGKKL